MAFTRSSFEPPLLDLKNARTCGACALHTFVVQKESCENGAYIGYNCPPKAPIISNPEQCNQTINELPQTLPSVHPTCNSKDENSFTYDSKPNFVDDSPNVFNHPPQPPMYSCEFCGNDARYGHYCTPQVSSIYPELCYNQDFNVPQDFHDFQLTIIFVVKIAGLLMKLYNFPVDYPPQATNKEILQAREDLMETIQAFLKEYDRIPPNKKCMALLLAEERFLKIKQVMREEHNQPEKKETAAQGFIPYWNFSMIDDEEARDNFLKDVCTFLRKFSRIPFGVTPKVILIAWERFGKIKGCFDGQAISTRGYSRIDE
ncbi:hypothetical protein Tco_0817413 [Tanacetum coccineum]